MEPIIFDRDNREIITEQDRRKKHVEALVPLAQGITDALTAGQPDQAAELHRSFEHNYLGAQRFPPVPPELKETPYQKKGAPQAAAASAKLVIDLGDPGLAGLVSPSRLSQQASYLARSAFHVATYGAAAKRVDVNSSGVYNEVHDAASIVATHVTARAGFDPALQSTLEPVTEFLEDRFNKAADSRAAGRRLKLEADEQAKKEVAAGAREEGRKEARGAIADLIEGKLK